MSSTFQPPTAIKGRGSLTRVPHRFTQQAHEPFDDGWNSADDGTPRPPATQVVQERARTALCRNDSPDIPFTHSINPYRGCEHGCVYCFARPTHSYLGLSPGLDFETRIIAKTHLADCLRAELLRRSYRPSVVSVGAATDAYQPVERQLRITRGVLEVLGTARHPVALITKGSGVERDLDLLAPLAARNLAAVVVTITTLDPHLARILEPRAASPARRLRTLRTLSEAGVPVGVSLAPQIPFINDDMEQVLAAAHAAGARSAFYAVLRLPWELQSVFAEWLQAHFPQRAERVLARLQDLHGIDAAGRAAGRVYRSAWGTRFAGSGPWADLLAQRFALVCRKLGLNAQRAPLDCAQFDPARLHGQQPLW